MAPIKKKTPTVSEPSITEPIIEEKTEKKEEVVADQPKPIEQPKLEEQPKVVVQPKAPEKKKMLRIKKRKKICASGQVIELKEGDLVDINYKRLIEGSVEYEEVLV